MARRKDLSGQAEMLDVALKVLQARACGIDASIVRELVGHEHQTKADRYYDAIQMNMLKQELKKFQRTDLIWEAEEE